MNRIYNVINKVFILYEYIIVIFLLTRELLFKINKYEYMLFNYKAFN